MPKTQKLVQGTTNNTTALKHHRDEKHRGEVCKVTDHETICLPDRSMGGHHYSVDTCVPLPDGHGCEWSRTYDQKSIHVQQQPVTLHIKENCVEKRPDDITVHAQLKDCHVDGGKVNVHVKAPKVHVERQKVNVVLVPGDKDKCQKPKVHVKWNCPKIHVDKPDVTVIIDKGCDVTAPTPVICVRRERHCGSAKTQ